MCIITYYILIGIVQERVERLLSEGWLNAHDCKVGILKFKNTLLLYIYTVTKSRNKKNTNYLFVIDF